MKTALFLLAASLVLNSACAQDDDVRSETERKIPPAKLQALAESRSRAQQELSRAADGDLSSLISNGLFRAESPIALITIQRVIPSSDGGLTVDLTVDKVLRGSLPSTLTIEHCYWSDQPWPLRPPLGAQRVKPEAGRKELAVFGTRTGGMILVSILNLDDPKDSAFLPAVLAATEMEAAAVRSGIAPYIQALANQSAAVRDLAFERLVHARQCAAQAGCETAILAETRHLLASNSPNNRMEALNWLWQLSSEIGTCRMRACAEPHFHDEKEVRAQLQPAIDDKNLIVGDTAFQHLAALDFHQKENAGWCAEIVPALRLVKKYQYNGEQHVIGGSLNAASVCLGK